MGVISQIEEVLLKCVPSSGYFCVLKSRYTTSARETDCTKIPKDLIVTFTLRLNIRLHIEVVKDVLLFIPQIWDQLVALVVRHYKLSLLAVR